MGSHTEWTKDRMMPQKWRGGEGERAGRGRERVKERKGLRKGRREEKEGGREGCQVQDIIVHGQTQECLGEQVPGRPVAAWKRSRTERLL